MQREFYRCADNLQTVMARFISRQSNPFSLYPLPLFPSG